MLQIYVIALRIYKLFLQLVWAAYFCSMNKCKKIDWAEFGFLVHLTKPYDSAIGAWSFSASGRDYQAATESYHNPYDSLDESIVD